MAFCAGFEIFYLESIKKVWPAFFAERPFFFLHGGYERFPIRLSVEEGSKQAVAEHLAHILGSGAQVAGVMFLERFEEGEGKADGPEILSLPDR